MKFFVRGTLADNKKLEVNFMKQTFKEIRNQSNIRALKEARIIKRLSRNDLANKLNVSYKAIEKVENGREIISDQKLNNYLVALEITTTDLQKIKRGKTINPKKRDKKVIKNSDRRSYQRIINKECRVLKSMRRIKNFSQDDASKLCGYSRPTIGHIENGRIELSKDRIVHIVKCYGYEEKDFEDNCKKSELRDEILDFCVGKIEQLSDEKLILIQGILKNL